MTDDDADITVVADEFGMLIQLNAPCWPDLLHNSLRHFCG
jgi:hypothetical protein